MVLCSLIQIIPAFVTLFLCNSPKLEGVEVKAVMYDSFLRVGWRLRGVLRMRSQGVDLGDRGVVKGTFSIFVGLLKQSTAGFQRDGVPSEISTAVWAC